jgi:hypothetical protein
VKAQAVPLTHESTEYPVGQASTMLDPDGNPGGFCNGVRTKLVDRPPVAPSTTSEVSRDSDPQRGECHDFRKLFSIQTVFW